MGAVYRIIGILAIVVGVFAQLAASTTRDQPSWMPVAYGLACLLVGSIAIAISGIWRSVETMARK